MSDHKYYASICLMVKNDQDYIREWIDYHLLIGFDHFYITDNNSDPPLKSILQNYIDKGLVTYKFEERTPAPNFPLQKITYNHIIDKYRQETKWLAIIDGDEFIVLKKHNNIKGFLQEYEDYAGVRVGWYVFGSNGHSKKQKFMLTSYNTRLPKSCHYKSIVQPIHIEEHYVHQTLKIRNDKFTVDEHKVRVPVEGRHYFYTTDIVQLNHYMLRSLEDLKEKNIRRGGSCERRPDEYYNNINRNAKVKDDRIIENVEQLIKGLNDTDLPEFAKEIKNRSIDDYSE